MRKIGTALGLSALALLAGLLVWNPRLIAQANERIFGSLTSAGGGNAVAITATSDGYMNVICASGCGAADGITGTLTAGRIPYASGAQTLVDTANLTWDNTNTSLSVSSSAEGTLETHGLDMFDLRSFLFWVNDNHLLLDFEAHSEDFQQATELSLYRTRGTRASPTPVLQGDFLGTYEVFALGDLPTGVDFALRENVIASEDWTATANGTDVRWGAHANGEHGNPVTFLYWQGASGLTVGRTGKPTVVQGSTVTASTIVTSGTAPAVANVGANSCGTTAATIAGNNNAGEITVGTVAGTQCRVTFTIAAPTRRVCTVTDATTTIATRAAYVDTTHSDFFGAFVAGDIVAYHCFAN